MTARVLVVDDLPVNVKLLEAKLIGEYFDVLTAYDGETALRVVRDQAPDIVLLDVMMPGVDGFEVCRRMKADPRVAHIPVVMITALSDVADRVRGLEAGADDFLTKPVNDIALFARVKSLARLKMMMDELRLREGTSVQLGALSEEAAAGASEPEGASLLLLDSDAASVERIRGILGSHGFRIRRVDDREALMAAVAEDSFDLVLLSLEVADDDALRLCSLLRSHENSRHLPIVLIVDEPGESRLVKALEIGVNDYIRRPIDRHELVARMRTQVRRKRYQDSLRSTYRLSLSLALTDALTGLYNRRYLSAHLAGQLKHGADSGKPLSVLLVDIDYFKTVNDTHGHAAGDQVLRQVARRIADNVRSFDTVARYGGEEFVVVMPDAEPQVAIRVAERLRKTIAETPVALQGDDEKAVTVTVSVGIGTATGSEPASAEDLLARADEALYAAKRGGRNQVRDAHLGDAPRRVEGAGT